MRIRSGNIFWLYLHVIGAGGGPGLNMTLQKAATQVRVQGAYVGYTFYPL